ncbi:MAG: hypothetical protein RIC55_21895 [Pirellulaceae bacterium]
MAAPDQTIDRVTATFYEAADANRRAAARRGNIIVLDPAAGDDVMITADLHGHRLNFNRLMEIADLSGHPRRHLVVQEVCHGGPSYPGGGCMSHLLLEDVARWKVEFPDRFHFLLSNHELSELTDFPIMKRKQVLNLHFREGLQQMYGGETETVRKAYCDFLASCPLGVRLVKSAALITHSVPKQVDEQGFDADVFDRPLQASDLSCEGAVFRLLWGRDFRPENVDAFARLAGVELLINGHEPCADGYCVPNRRQVILDCCGDNACYLVLPLDRKLTQQQIVKRIARLS